ncbi:MAG: AMP-binding protein [Candidatus Tectomicrobia bacterium]|uniref:AMP-binding protein n=1 Tax=Tectimicrobiota bacterium TaxID=2528274 RepID=A0A938B6D4_UNCTE|nr:AMP-binding protein [Candidatus Tectomicrobia bacterium]
MRDWYEKKTLGALLDEAAARWGTREALTYEGQRWSFAALQTAVDRTARALLHLGIQPGDRVALWLPNRPEWLYSFFALAKIGAVVVPINTRFRTSDLAYVLWQSDATTLITVDRSGPVDYLAMVHELCPSLASSTPGHLHVEQFPQFRHVVVMGAHPGPGAHHWDEVVTGAAAVSPVVLQQRQQQIDPDATVLTMYTSGTTGFPKGVMHSHNIQRTVVDAGSRMGITSMDVIVMYLPLFHVFGLYEGLLMSVATGARMVLTTLFEPGEVLRLIVQEGGTVLNGFDTHFHALTTHPDCAQIDRRRLRTGLFATGMASSEPAARRTQRLLCSTVTGWGMTEIGCGVTRSFLDASEDDRCLASGCALPGYECKVIDPTTGLPVPYGTAGELYVRGYSLMQGYYKKPEETAAAIDAEGWLHTGDVVTMREDGTIRFLGRYKDLLKVGGENVDPIEVEGFLLRHPAIDQVQIIGVPDPRLSEVPCACVILKPGTEVTQEALVAFCRGQLASFKIPQYTVIMEAFPMTSSGKVQKFRLREIAAAHVLPACVDSEAPAVAPLPS